MQEQRLTRNTSKCCLTGLYTSPELSFQNNGLIFNKFLLKAWFDYTKISNVLPNGTKLTENEKVDLIASGILPSTSNLVIEDIAGIENVIDSFLDMPLIDIFTQCIASVRQNNDLFDIFKALLMWKIKINVYKSLVFLEQVIQTCETIEDMQETHSEMLSNIRTFCLTVLTSIYVRTDIDTLREDIEEFKIMNINFIIPFFDL